MEKYKNIYTDEINHRFSIVLDEACELIFLYWHELKRHKVRFLKSNSYFNASLSNSVQCEHSRGKSIDQISFENLDLTIECMVIEGQSLCRSDFAQLIDGNENQPLIFIKCRVLDDFEFDETLMTRSVAFIQCEFQGSFRLVNCEIQGSLWLPNCKFASHFSLKATYIKEDVHLEGADFSGVGGISFRGVRAKNLYLDLGVNGSDDLVWLNEIRIDGVLSIGGDFKSEIQILRQQDRGQELDFEPYIGCVVIGKELYCYENANKTRVGGGLRVEGVWLSDNLIIENLDAELISLKGLIAKSICCKNLSVDKDLIIEGCDLTTCLSKNTIVARMSQQLVVLDSSVGRHCKIDSNTFCGLIDLHGTAVAEVTYFENNTLGQSAQLGINRFTSSRFIIYPAKVLYGNSKSNLLRPKVFGLLKVGSDKHSGDQYCALKHWLGDSGQLELEDVAFFHMRNSYQSNKIARLILGGVFGWGVRLSNIAFFSLLLIICFGGVYLSLEPKSSLSSAIALSAQSFISSFFGKWSDYPPGGLISWVVTLESFFGVIFITVFVGAYIRKLLR